MKLLDKIAGRFGFRRVMPVRHQRSYAAAAANRLTEDWQASLGSPDSEINSGGKTLRARARQMERDNPFVERYLKLLENNVLGATGVGLQMKVRDPDKFDGQKVVKGRYDTLANQTIEAGWMAWGKKGTCCVDGRTSWLELQRLVLRSTARDGSCFLIKRRGKELNRFGFAVQFLEADYLADSYSAQLPGGNIVRSGIELTPDGKTAGYYFYNRHPYEFGVLSAAGVRVSRVDASRVVHVFRPTRGGQTNGASWIAPSMLTLRQLDGYWEAELVAARSAASKMGFYEKTVPDGYQGEVDSQGNPTQEMQPGVIEDLPMGVTFKTHDPQHPVSAFGDFVKSVLRGASAGMGVSYNSLANDLEGVNYSSIRAGLLEERSEWMAIQNWFIESVIEPIWAEWFPSALMASALTMPNGSALPVAKEAKFNAPEWKPRRWAWVDPLKDLNAKVLAIEKGLDSRRSAIAEQGGDIEDVFADLAADADLASSYGLSFSENGAEFEEADNGEMVKSANGKEDGEGDREEAANNSEIMPATADVQSQALNGAQLASITQVLADVSAGRLSPKAATILIQIALPTANADVVSEMIADASKFKPAKDEPPSIPATNTET